MVTEKQFGIYKKYYGDSDMFQRFATKKQKKIMNEFNWRGIDQIVQDIHMIFNNNASPEYEQQVFAKLNEEAPDLRVREEIMDYGRNLHIIQQKYKDILTKWL